MVISRVGQLPEPTSPASQNVAAVGLDPALVSHLCESGHEDALRARALRPERWLAVDLDLSGDPISVAGFQAPYAAGRHLWDTIQNRLTKREAYRQLTRWVIAERDAGRPVIVGMDGNNWYDWLEPDDVRPEHQKRYRNQYRKLADEANLFDVEKAFHGPNPPTHLVDTLRQAALDRTIEDHHGSREAAKMLGGHLGMTYRLKHDAPPMDRIYAGPEVPVRRAGICHGHLDASTVARLQKGARLCVGSDHALVWADFGV